MSNEAFSADQILDAIPADVTVVAVSKLQPVEKIRALHERHGHLDFGENYVQEALAKQVELASLALKWHFIGSLQTNKVKSIVGKFDLIHSVDSLRLAEKISQQAEARNLRQKVLLQINVAGEDSKGGFDVSEFHEQLGALTALAGLEIRGLMTMPPLSNDPEQSRVHFRRLRELLERMRSSGLSATELSMGTSGDFQVAIEEGATLVRLGSVLFGERPSRNSA